MPATATPRPGRDRSRASILILVVALLTLLALIGTAFLVTARTDRVSAIQHVRNVRGDMAVESAINVVVSEVVGELFNQAGGAGAPEAHYRRPNEVGLNSGDSFRSRTLLASRVPVVPDPSLPVTPLYPSTPNLPLLPAPGGVNPAGWIFVSDIRPGLEVRNPVFPDGYDRFYSLPSARENFLAPTARPFLGQPLWPFLQPYSKWYRTAATSWTSDGTFKPFDVDDTTPEIDPIPAADVDGDGVADAVLWESLTPAPVDGLVYYFAVRVIDNNSAVNVNTALARNFDFDGRGDRADEPLLFKGRVGLAEMLRTYNPLAGSLLTLGPEMSRLNAWRLNDTGLRVAGVYSARGADRAGLARPFDDASVPRDDFLYSTVTDLLDRQLGSRLGNPGFARPLRRFRTFSLSDQMALADKFCLAKGGESPTPLEEVLFQSLRRTGGPGGVVPVPSKPYSPVDTPAWFERFRYDAEDPGRPETFRDRRALLVARNPLANLSPTTLTPANWNQWRMQGAGAYPTFDGPRPLTHQTRVHINSAPFEELWRGFWGVMRKLPQSGPVPYLNDPSRTSPIDTYFGMRFAAGTFVPVRDQIHPSMMFRPSIRDPRVPYTAAPGADGPIMMILLRAALAAVNTEDLRDVDADVSAHRIRLPGLESAAAVRVYGTERQPFITEVYVNTDDRAPATGGPGNPNGYVAIELHNPYDVPINMGPPTAAGGPNGWSVGVFDRRSAAPVRRKLLNLDGTVPGPTDPPWRFPYGTVIPAKGFLVLENFDAGSAGAGRARYRPGAAAAGGALGPTGPPTDAGCRTVFVPNLHRVLTDAAVTGAAAGGGEFVLLRTRRADGTAVDNSGDAADPFNERLNLHDLVPVDQMDFTGVRYHDVQSNAPLYYNVHYVRANDPGAAPSGAWRFVYPGRYDASRPAQRHQGMQQRTYQPPASDDPAFYASPVRLGRHDAAGHPNQGSFPIQIGPVEDWPGPRRPRRGEEHRRPFGLFAREGDVLQVPFIGAYAIYAPPVAGSPADLYEVQSVSMDCAFAEDCDTADDWPGRPGEQWEQVGRFCPVKVTMPGRTQVIDDYISDFAIACTYPLGDPTRDLSNFRTFFRYRWTRDLFDHFTVEAPHNDFLPNVTPTQYRFEDGAAAGPPPQPVANTGGVAGNADPSDPQGTANDPEEVAQPIEGRININTAPWKVLASLPLVVDPVTGKVDVVRTEELAKAIVYFRDVHDGTPTLGGPQVPRPRMIFTSILGLNDVVDLRPPELRRPEFRAGVYGFRDGYGSFDPSGTGPEPGTPAGDLSPYRPGNPSATDGVRGDFEEQFLNVTRISNLITTHSDSFTCYVYVVGVQNAGTPMAAAKVERRAGFIVDRSAVTPERPVARVQRFSQE